MVKSYQISEEEAGTELPVYKILQVKWGSTILSRATTRLRFLHKKAIKERWSLVMLQEEIDAYIGKLREECPEEFPTVGWWDKKQANVAMKESKIKGKGEFEVCKVCNIRLPSSRSDAGACMVGGELWVVHRRCVKKG